jgi:hypothetical protein
VSSRPQRVSNNPESRPPSASSTRSEDTRAAIDRLVFDGIAAMSPAERLLLAARLCAAAEQLSIAGLRLRHPRASEEELHRRAGALRLGRDLTLRAFGVEAEAWLS